MPFIQIEELKAVMYSYQMHEITEGDEDIVLTAIESAIEEVQSYLRPNNKREWQDGRLTYDVDAIFNATGSDRNPLILRITLTIAAWWIVQLSNVDMIYENVKDRYDRAISWLLKVNRGEVTPRLPVLEPEEGTGNQPQAFSSGSRKKFNHE